ncbi:MAG TPA: AMP-binding protein, partial [Chloroflexota bacterium]
MEITVPAEMNVCDLLLDENVRRGRGGKVAVISGEREVTYSELVEMTSRLANGLVELGLRPEERVLILLPDSVEFVVAYLGVMRLGAIAVPLNTLLKPQDYAYLLADSRAAAIIVHADYVAEVPCGSSSWLRYVVVVGNCSGGAG